MVQTVKNENKKLNKKIKKIKKNIAEVLILSLIIFIVIFTVYQIIKLAIHPTETFLVEEGTISQTESLIGYIIRDEEILQSDENQNKIVQIKNEGEKVAVGETVFRYKATNEEELNAKIEELNVEIQKAMDGQKLVPSSDIKALEKQIENKIDGMQEKNNIQEIKEYKKDIDNYIVKKAKISGELSPAGSYINNLINERISLENELKNCSEYKNTLTSGIISYRVDGLEQRLLPTELERLTSNELEELDLVTGQIVTTSNSQGKIINNFECYIAIPTKSMEAKNAEVGDKIKIKLASNQEIPATIEYINREENNNVIIIKVTQGVEYLISYRKISLDVIWWEEEGLRVPNTSFIFENGLSYIVRKKAGILSKILVRIVNENENYSIITNYKTDELKNIGYTVEKIKEMQKISIYDEILTNPDIEKISKELN